MKRPAFQFYPADWRKDVELRSCSIAARGLWIDLLCLAHECEPYGHLTVNGRAMTPVQMAGQVGLSAAQCAKLLQELTDNGVARKTPEGVIYSKRMVEDEDLRQRRAEGGKAGSEFGAMGGEHGSKGGRPRKETGDKKPPLEPPPSSSSSSSPSGKPSDPDGSGAEAPLKSPAPLAPPPPPPTDRDVVFAAGVAMLTAANITDKNARSFLAMQCKAHGEAAVRAALDRCAEDRPIEPVTWLQAALKAKPSGPAKSKFIADREAQASRWFGTATLPGIGGDVIDAEEAAHGAAPAIR